MTVYVDQIQQWPTTIRCFKGGSCHLWADTLDELHAFAARIGLKRGWFQEHRIMPHYDLTPARRERALAAGAQEASAKRWIAARMAPRGGLERELQELERTDPAVAKAAANYERVRDEIIRKGRAT